MQVKIVKKPYGPRICINGEEFAPFAFKSFRPTKRNVSDFYNAGVRLFCVLSTGMQSATEGVYYSKYGESWIDDYTYDFAPIDRQIDMFISAAPNAYLEVMLLVDTRDWWLKKYPEYPNSFWKMSSVCSDERWRAAALAYLTAAVKHVEEKYGDKVFGYHIMGGSTTEWLSEKDFEEPSEIKERAYKAYINDALATVPTKEQRELPTSHVFLDPENDANLICYRRFHSEIVADTILYFAKGVKEAVNYKKLVGVYYGYVQELGGSRLWNSGHLACDKVFNSDYIDIVSAPSAYSWWRRSEGTVGYMTAVDTLTLNDKIFFQEFDHRTFLNSLQFESKKLLPGESDGAKSKQETINMIRRELVSVLSKGVSMWWFDMFEGWYYDEALMQEIRKCFEVERELSERQCKSVAEIAVIIDAESLYYVNKNAHINSELISWERAELSKTGSPYDTYMSGSLSKIDFSKYKLVIFLNQFKLTSEQEKIINEKIKKDNKTILWAYAPGYVSDTLDENTISRVVGMEVAKLSNPETIINANGTRFGFTFPKDTMFYVKLEGDDYFTIKEKGAEVLGRYQISLTPALVRKHFGDYNGVFCASGYIPAEVLRDIAAAAGVHIYSHDSDNAVYATDKAIGVYHRTEKNAEIFVKEDGEYVDLFSGKVYKSRDKKLSLDYCEQTACKCLVNLPTAKR